MMWFMARGTRGDRGGASEPSLAALEAEQTRLAAKVEALQSIQDGDPGRLRSAGDPGDTALPGREPPPLPARAGEQREHAR